MQPPVLHGRYPLPTCTNHTPRDWEITALDPVPSLRMFGPSGMLTRPVPLSPNIGMGQTSSSGSGHGVAPKASSSVLREEFSSIGDDADYQMQQPSRPDSWSMHYDCTNQAPYTVTKNDGTMVSPTSLAPLPPGNASHDLALFLKMTGPTAPHRRPSRMGQSRLAVSTPKSALRFFKLGGHKRPTPQVQSAHERLNGVLRDEGGLLADIDEYRVPDGVEQKTSSTGKRYLALQIDTTRQAEKRKQMAPTLNLNILESRVSVCFPEDTLNDWPLSLSKPRAQHEGSESAGSSRVDRLREGSVASRLARRCPTPVRPAASDPPSPVSPVPESAVSMADSYRSDLAEHPAKQSFDMSSAGAPATQRAPDAVHSSEPPSRFSFDMLSLPDGAVGDSVGDSVGLESVASPETPDIILTMADSPIERLSPGKEVEIKHPSPRRFASHPVLLQRASSITTSFPKSRSSMDDPGSPPPRSPLRLRRDPRTIENIIATHNSGKLTPKIAPSIKLANDHHVDMDPIRATVTTECSGPIKRPRSRNKDSKTSVLHPAYPMSRKEREARVRARKLRDRPSDVHHTIDAVVNETGLTARQRLKKIRPHIQIPDLRPAPLRAHSAASVASASSAASWKKVTESTLLSVSPVPSADSGEDSQHEKTGYTPTTPKGENVTAPEEGEIALSPVMLVAEEIPIPRAKSTPKPTRIVVKEGRSYAPRPRSASMSRAAQRRSRTSVHASPRLSDPDLSHFAEEETPPLPSPPPNRALPPTPPASGSEKPGRTKNVPDGKKDVPHLPMPVAPSLRFASSKVGGSSLSSSSTTTTTTAAPVANKRGAPLPHVVSQIQRKPHSKPRFETRLTLLEKQNAQLGKQNALLSAALMAVLRTNGSLNGPVEGEAGVAERPKTPMAWEARIARRSAASHAPSSSNDSALEMYMSTRRESRRGAR